MVRRYAQLHQRGAVEREAPLVPDQGLMRFCRPAATLIRQGHLRAMSGRTPPRPLDAIRPAMRLYRHTF
jgi:hypothetical protein